MNPDELPDDLSFLNDMDAKEALEQASKGEDIRYKQLVDVTRNVDGFRAVYDASKEGTVLEQSNYAELKKEFPFLDEKHNLIGFDLSEDGAVEEKFMLTANTKDERRMAIEHYLFQIDEGVWDSFIESALTCRYGEALNEEDFSDREYKELENNFDAATRLEIGENIADRTDWGFFAVYVGTAMSKDDAMTLYNVSDIELDLEHGEYAVDIEDLVQNTSQTQIDNLFKTDEFIRGWAETRKYAFERFLPVFEQALRQLDGKSDGFRRFLHADQATQIAYIGKLVPDSNYYDPQLVQLVSWRSFAAPGTEGEGEVVWNVSYGEIGTRQGRNVEHGMLLASKKLAQLAVETDYAGLEARRLPPENHPVLNFESVRSLVASLLEEEEDDTDFELELPGDSKSHLLDPEFMASFVETADGMDIYVTDAKELLEQLLEFDPFNEKLDHYGVVAVPTGTAVNGRAENSWCVVFSMETMPIMVGSDGYSLPGTQNWPSLKGGAAVAKAVVDLFLERYDYTYTNRLRGVSPEDVAGYIYTQFGNPSDYSRFRDAEALSYREERYFMDQCIELGSRGDIETATKLYVRSGGGDKRAIRREGVSVHASSLNQFFFIYSDESSALDAFEGYTTGVMDAPSVKFSELLPRLDEDSLNALRKAVVGSTLATDRGEDRVSDSSVLNDRTLLSAFTDGVRETPVVQIVQYVLKESFRSAWNALMAGAAERTVVEDIEKELGQLTHDESVEKGVRCLVPWNNMLFYLKSVRERDGFDNTFRFIDLLELEERGEAGNFSPYLDWEHEEEFDPIFNDFFVSELEQVKGELPAARNDKLQTKLDL